MQYDSEHAELYFRGSKSVVGLISSEVVYHRGTWLPHFPTVVLTYPQPRGSDRIAG